jgi:hypothetical protein
MTTNGSGGPANGLHNEPHEPQEAPVFVVNFGLTWRQIIGAATVLSGLLGTAGFTGWLVLPSDLTPLKNGLAEVQRDVTTLKTGVKDLDEVTTEVVIVLRELRQDLARMRAGDTLPGTIDPPPELLSPAPFSRRRAQGIKRPAL